MPNADSLDTPLGEVLILARVDGEPRTNVPHLVQNHANGAFDWGARSGPSADLALNAVEFFVREMDEVGEGKRVECLEGEIDRLTWRLYPYFLVDFLEEVPPRGGRIGSGEIREWIRGRPLVGEANVR
jgi:hypothetical protein